MVKEITSADDYKFSLSDELKEIAESELRESVGIRKHALKSLRDWVKQNPRIESIRMDASFFLRFLRAKKFSLPMVQECIERYLLLRKSYEGTIFQNMDITLPSISTLIDLGYIFALPKRDKLGRRMVFTRPGVFDPYKFSNFEMLKIHGLTYETLLEDEENQIRGFVHIVDASGVSFPHLTLFTPKEAVRIVKNAERTLPMRHKEINAINVNPSIKFAVDFALALVTEKMKKRIHFYTSIDKASDLDKTLMPLEYGGTMPMKEMIDLWKEELLAKQKTVLMHDKMTVRLNMYSPKEREGAVSALRQPFGCGVSGDLCGLQGSFRKLEVD